MIQHSTPRWMLLLGFSGLLQLPSDARAEPSESATGGVIRAAADNAASKPDSGAVDSPDLLTPAEQRTLGGEDDPMGLAEAQREAQRVEEQEGKPEQTTGFDFYGSIRVRYREQGDSSDWQDGGSRIGAETQWQLRTGSFLFGRYEAGFNVLTGLERLSAPGEQTGEFQDTTFTRLGYAGLDAPKMLLVGGKNWSTYYEVAGFTDRFMGTGGSASGVFNAQTDGGATGTGRADRTLQTKLSVDFLPEALFQPFELNLQAQHGNPIPFAQGLKYGTAVGFSAVATTRKSLALSVAYNHAEIDIDEDPVLRDIGLTGSARALLVGTRAFGDRWYAGLVGSRLENHVTSDEGVYFDGWGSELYAEYRLYDRFWLVGGYNLLKPDSDQDQAADYLLRYGVAELRYTFDGFRQMFFANVRIDDSRAADGTPGSDVYTVGLRWDLSRRGWWLFR